MDAPTVTPRVRSYWLADEPGALMLQRRRARSSSRGPKRAVEAADDGVHIRVLHGSWEDATATLTAHGELSDPTSSLADRYAFSNVRALHLIACNLSWAHIAQLPRMATLSTLDLSDNALEAASLENEPGSVHLPSAAPPHDAIMACAPAVTTVCLQGCGLTVLPVLPSCVRSLNLAFNQLAHVDGIERHAGELVQLQLQGNNISKGRVLLSLACLARMQELHIHPNPVTLVLPAAALRKQLVFCLALTQLDGQPFLKREVHGSRRGARAVERHRDSAVTATVTAKTVAWLRSPTRVGDDTSFDTRASRTVLAVKEAASLSPIAGMTAAQRTARVQAQRASVAALSSPPRFLQKRLTVSSPMVLPELPPRARVEASTPHPAQGAECGESTGATQAIDASCSDGDPPLALHDLTGGVTATAPDAREAVAEHAITDVDALRLATAHAALISSLEALEHLNHASSAGEHQAAWAQLSHIQSRTSRLGLLMLSRYDTGVTLQAAEAVCDAASAALTSSPTALAAIQVCLQACMTVAVLLRAQWLLPASTGSEQRREAAAARSLCARFAWMTRKGLPIFQT